MRARSRFAQGPIVVALLALLVPAARAGTSPARADASAEISRAEVAAGDAAFARRADGFLETGTADATAVAEALAHYERAVAADPGDLSSRFKLIEALYFQGHFVVTDRKERKALVDRQLAESQAVLDRLAGEEGVAEGPDTVRAHFWSAISWGVWAMGRGNLAAARRGAAGHIRDHAQRVIDLDERFADAGGLRLLGRLHTATPKIPMFTGWIDRGAGIEMLEQACALSTDDARNPLFLAEALLRFEPERRGEALTMLREVVVRSPRPEALVEESEILEQARQLLAETDPSFGEAASGAAEETSP